MRERVFACERERAQEGREGGVGREKGARARARERGSAEAVECESACVSECERELEQSVCSPVRQTRARVRGVTCGVGLLSTRASASLSWLRPAASARTHAHTHVHAG
eukprot:1845105-Pleurochrysis_carterae.AAC.1